MAGIAIALLILGGYLLWQPLSVFNFSAKDILMSRPVEGRVTVVTSAEKWPPAKKASAEPKVNAVASAAYDTASNFRLTGNKEYDPRPIASITKLMTALVFLDHNPGWDEHYTMTKSDYREGGRIHLYPGDTLAIRDLFRTALVASDNVAVIGLVSATGMSEKAFVAEMNKKAKALSLEHTGFFDPTGLDPRNISSARDVARMAEAAFDQPDIADSLKRTSYDFTTKEGNIKHVETTDDLLEGGLPGDIAITAGKTGSLPQAGYCFVGQFEKNGKKIITVVLGAPSEAARFSETKKLVEWAYRSYEWK